MSAKQSKRAHFAHRQSVKRWVARVMRENQARQGFLGAVHRFTITDEEGNTRHFGRGALFQVATPAPLQFQKD